MLSIQNAVSEINSEKVFAAKQATSGVSATVDLSGVNDPLSYAGGKLCRASGQNQPMLVLQSDQDFYYAFGTTSGGSVTAPAGASPGVLVKAGAQEYVRPAQGASRVFLYVLQASAAGTVVIFKAAAQ
jgi:hypothetical protein